MAEKGRIALTGVFCTNPDMCDRILPTNRAVRGEPLLWTAF